MYNQGLSSVIGSIPELSLITIATFFFFKRHVICFLQNLATRVGRKTSL